MTVMTKSSKEYELIDEGNKDIAVVLFRSYGAMGYPDLHRRPGQAQRSGLHDIPNTKMSDAERKQL